MKDGRKRTSKELTRWRWMERLVSLSLSLCCCVPKNAEESAVTKEPFCCCVIGCLWHRLAVGSSLSLGLCSDIQDNEADRNVFAEGACLWLLFDTFFGNPPSRVTILNNEICRRCHGAVTRVLARSYLLVGPRCRRSTLYLLLTRSRNCPHRRQKLVPGSLPYSPSRAPIC